MQKPKCCMCGIEIEANGHFCLIRYGIVCMECAEKIRKRYESEHDDEPQA